MGFDFQHMMELWPDISKAFGETLYMIGVSLAIIKYVVIQHSIVVIRSF
ncbi:hypothetical protein [Planococcus sp. YIM B11945]